MYYRFINKIVVEEQIKELKIIISIAYSTVVLSIVVISYNCLHVTFRAKDLEEERPEVCHKGGEEVELLVLFVPVTIQSTCMLILLHVSIQPKCLSEEGTEVCH